MANVLGPSWNIRAWLGLRRRRGTPGSKDFENHRLDGAKTQRK